MFGDRKDQEDQAPPAPAAADPAPAAPAASDTGSMAEFGDRLLAMGQLVMSLTGGGSGTATITAVEEVFHNDMATEFQVTGDVLPDGGEPFEASFPVFRQGLQGAPEVGGTFQVLFDPNDHSRVAKLPDIQARKAQSTPWVVPDHCPECGAVVDQSVASMAAHPTCPFCQNPLPCHR